MPGKGILRIKILGDAKGVDGAVGVAVDKLKAGALAMGAVFVAGLNKAFDVEAATDKMSASLGLTAKESERLGGVAGKLYAQAYGESIEEVSGAVESVISSIDGMRNASASAVEGVTAKVLNLASAFELEAGRAAQIAGQMVKSGFAENATQALDLLTVGLQRVPKMIREDLVDALDEYTPFMKTVGLEGARGMQLLVNGAQKGMYGIDKTGDAIKEFTIRATDMSTASKAGFDLIGVSQKKMTTEILAGGNRAAIAFDQIVKGIIGIKDPAKQSQAALALFGPPLEDLSTSEIPKFLGSLLSTQDGLGQVAGAADKMGQTLNDNAKTNLTQFWRTLQMVFVDFLGGKVIPIITAVAGWLSTNLGPALRTVGSIINTVVITPLRAMFEWLGRNGDAIGLIASVAAGALAPFLAFRGVAMLIVGAMRIWTAVTKGLVIAQTLLNLVMRANPIGIVITLVGALVGAIVWLWNKSAAFRHFFKGVWNAVKPAISAVGDVIGWVVDRIADAVAWAQNLIDIASRALGLGGSIQGEFSGGGIKPMGRATGGSVMADTIYKVGERGPELFLPGVNGTVLSNADTSALLSQADQQASGQLRTMAAGAGRPTGGGTTVVQNFNFPNYVGSRAELTRHLRGAVRQSGRGSAERYFQGAP